MVFRISTKHVFLTYPQCTIEKEVLLDHLSTLLSDYTPHIRVAQELHEDGHPHLHAFIRLERKLDTRSERYFDLRDKHPNIESRIRNPQATFDYVSKDDNYIDYGQPDPQSKLNKWTKITSSTTEEEYWSTIRTTAPREWLLNLDKLEYFALKNFGTKKTTYTSPHAGFLTADLPQLQNWVDSSIDAPVSIFFIPIIRWHILPSHARGRFFYSVC